MEIQCLNLFKRHNTSFNVGSLYDYEVTTELNQNGKGIKHFLLEYLFWPPNPQIGGNLQKKGRY